MAIKKSTDSEDLFDVMLLLKQWWYHRKLVIIGTIIIALITSFMTILFNKALVDHRQAYIVSVLQGDFGKNNQRIVSAFRSNEYISRALKKLGIKISATDILDNLIVKNSTDPLKESLTNQISALEHKDLKKLSLNDDELGKMIENINDNSQSSITIQLYHLPLGLSPEQAENFIVALTVLVNKEILLRTNREDTNLNYIDLENLDITSDNFESFTRLTGLVDTIQSNLAVMKVKYAELLVDVDFRNLDNSANFCQKLLHELSIKLGNTISIDSLSVNIQNKNNDIRDLQQSLKDLTLSSRTNVTDEDRTTSSIGSNVSTQIDGGLFDKILDMGGSLSFNEFRLTTMKKIQNLQGERNALIKQKDLLNLPSNSDPNQLTMKNVSFRIGYLSESINSAISQIRNFTQPRAAVKIIKNPELVVLNSKTLIEFIYHILTFSLLGFVILSLTSLLLPKRLKK
ncbi:hypothetical protein N8832_00570 [Candidatus Pelagibacter sp.]|nr:hypothetical protein [Candidatus Pelagibacter sp.]